MTQSPITVAVGMSGGVDSSLTAALLKKQGFKVIGLTMKIYGGELTSSAARGHACYGPGEEEDIAVTADVAEQLEIPLHVIDLQAEYREHVLGHFKHEYLAGRTPNPCTRCNPLLKFGFLLEKARATGIVFDRFATGHYVRVCRDEQRGRYVLKKALNQRKDQSYFLYALPPTLLKQLMFPLGEMSKEDVRSLAHDYKLPVSARPESQDFIEGGAYDGLFDPADIKPGPIIDSSGRELGKHRGIIHYTIGQRRGIGIAHSEPLYVTEIDVQRNAVVVGLKDALFATGLQAAGLHLLSTDKLQPGQMLQARIRNGHTPAPATITACDGNTVTVKFDQPQMSVTPGQAVVFYDDDVVLGGAVIEKPLTGTSPQAEMALET
jgi:tRNA-specific 2-thiouridylase